MKKSKIVTIGLLALSIAGCHRKEKRKRPTVQDWQSANNGAYISTDGGNTFQHGDSGVPFWWWYYMGRVSGGSYGYSPGVSYYSGHYYGGGGRIGSFHESAGGHSVSVRGGFGSSGHAVSAHS
jgi:hypothetical protein